MNCPKCGWQNPDNAVKCANCFANMQATQNAMPPQQPNIPQQNVPRPVQSVPDYLVGSILVTVFCCMPFGIAAIVKAVQANSKKNTGDYYGAMQDAEASKKWMYWSVGASAVWGILYAISIFMGISSGARHF